VRIVIAYGGSCAGRKREDLLHYHARMGGGARMRVAPGTRFFPQFGSQDVRDYCVRNGMLDVFERVGVELVEPGSGACVNAGSGVSERADQVTISAINRKFFRRRNPIFRP
jgi:3-isopropylmalate/(R)-2-methylmalate dehydratase large subunit